MAAPRLAAKPFTYEIKARSVLAENSGLTVIGIDGKDAKAVANQIVIEVDDDWKLPKILAKHGLKLIEQESIPEKPSLKGERGNFEQTPLKQGKKLNTYLVEYTAGDDESSDDLQDRALRLKGTGHYSFNSKRDAAFFNKILKLNEDADSGIKSANGNSVSEPCFTQSEGKNSVSNQYQNNPSGTEFQWMNSLTDSVSPHIGANLNRFDTFAAWNYYSGQGVLVAVIDGGFLEVNESRVPYEIVRNNYYTYNGIDNSYNISGQATNWAGQPFAFPEDWHGRRVASAIFAPDNDVAGTVGTGNGATPILMKTDYTMYRNKACIDTAVYWGAKVINMSYGATNIFWGSSADKSSMQTAASNGRILLAAAGNLGYDANFYPANYTGTVIGVGSYSPFNGQVTYSNYSNNITIFAPTQWMAVGIQPGSSAIGYTAFDGGTSLATAVVSGVVAAMVEGHWVSDFTSAQNRLISTSRQNVYNPHSGLNEYGLDGLNAVRGWR